MTVRHAQDLFESVERIADAVLFEGYVLYPYRASAAKNQFRWQFGVVAPHRPDDEGEPWFTQTDCVIALDRSAGRQACPRLSARVRYLRPQATDSGWLEGIPQAVDVPPIELTSLPLTRQATLDAGIDARLVVEADARDEKFVTVRLRLENHEPWRGEFEHRDAMLARSLAGAHLLLSIEGGTFVSLFDPPDEAALLVAASQNRHTWPVLVGDRSRQTLMLSSPIVLYDFPAVAAESQCDLCDAAEIDEILSLRILTMTDEEKQQARDTDPRARAILDRVESLSPDAFAALHGAMRSADFFNPRNTPSPDEAFVLVGDRRVARGSKVRLHPNRRADSMDMFLAGQVATVAAVQRDVDDRTYIAVTIDVDPAASLHDSFGRYFYFDPSEVEPVDQEQEPV